MANVPNYNDLQRQRRLAMNDVASYKMVMQRRGAPQATVFFYLSTVDNSIYTKTPVKMQTLTVPVISYAVWITNDTVNWPVSSLYVQPVY